MGSLVGTADSEFDGSESSKKGRSHFVVFGSVASHGSQLSNVSSVSDSESAGCLVSTAESASEGMGDLVGTNEFDSVSASGSSGAVGTESHGS